MDRRKIEVKYIEDNSTRQATFSKRRADIFKKADELAMLCSVAVAVLINCPVGQPHTYISPGFDEVLGNFQNPYPERERSSSSLKQARIQKMQDRLNRIMEELEAEKEREKVLKKRKEETLKKYNMKEVASLKLEELVAFKKMLEAHRDIIKHERMEKEASSSLLMLSKNRKKKNNKKKKMMT